MCKLLPFHKWYKAFQKADWFIKLILYNIFAFSIFFILAYKVPLHNLKQYLIAFFIGLLLFVSVNAELLISHFYIGKERKRLQAYDNYLPIIRELVSQVRERQHDHANNIQAMQMLPLSYKDYDSLSSALLRYADYLSEQPFSYELLKLNLTVVSGFLISKLAYAHSEDKQLQIQIKNYQLHTNVPEYQLIDIIGILVDNAIEATPPKETAYLILDSRDNHIMVQTKNIGLPLTEDLKNKMFSKGYTTKTKDSTSHGIGLHKLKKLVDSYHGTITLSNEQIDTCTYLCFKVIV